MSDEMGTTTTLLTESESRLAGTEQVKHTPGPWEYVASTVHHGPYVTSNFGSTICDCYVMSHPEEPSTASGGRSKPIPFLHEMADPNARLIAAAPDLLAALKQLSAGMNAAHDSNPAVQAHEVQAARAAIAKAEGRTP